MHHAYYQHSFPPNNNENQHGYIHNHPRTLSGEFLLEDAAVSTHRKQSESSEQSDLAERRSVDWGSSDSEGVLTSLIANAWEGLYCKAYTCEFKNEEEIENGCWEKNEEEGEDVLTTFDFTFI